MRCVPAEPAPRALGLLLALVLTVTGCTAGPGSAEAGPAAEPAARAVPDPPAYSRDAAGRGLVAALQEALTTGSRSQVRELAAAGDQRARRTLAAMRHNVRALDVVALSLDYLATSGPTPRDPGRSRGDTWVAEVRVRWRLRALEGQTNTMRVAFTLTREGDTAAFVRAGGQGRRVPLWMLGRLRVRQTSRSLVAVAGGQSPDRYTRLAGRAVSQVGRVLGGWSGPLVLFVPASTEQLTAALGADRHAYDGIAAVTVAADGSASAGAVARVLVNPRALRRLGPTAQQIVMTHETTHVATGAVASQMPVWLQEGFADYVSMAAQHLPVTVLASQALQRVRRHGPPRSLPGSSDFQPENPTLGATYELAWLACRRLADRYGQRGLVRLYRRVDSGVALNAALGRLFGTDRKTLVAGWQDYLLRLAGRP